ncbi:hypothetical protein F4781DRAFT_439085 [Annulohypoxylon bovei var. microspora]|nr:hypothetical protein F4781DRAFT_439085 [Annulohypoxylon bovei var. microspora]
MEPEHQRNTERPRRVSISTLPELTRAGTFEIEFTYAINKHRYQAKQFMKTLKKILKAVGRVLKYIALVPCLPGAIFFILADKVMMAMQREDPVEFYHSDQSLDDITLVEPILREDIKNRDLKEYFRG